MHYCVLLLTKEFPTDKVIDRVMEPYKSEDYYRKLDAGEDVERPMILHDYWQIGGRYNGKFKLRFDHHDDASQYEWMFMAKEPRAGRLFRSYLLEEFEAMFKQAKTLFLFEDDYYGSMGCRDGYLYVDGGYIPDLLNVDEECTRCYGLIDVDGTAYARERYNGKEWLNVEDFDDKAKGIFAARNDCYVTCLDIHD